MTRRAILAVISLAVGVLGVDCVGLAGAASLELTGAGATFPLPFYQAVFDAFRRQTGIPVQYRGIGSGDGVKALTGRRVDFAATDAFMSPQEMAEAPAEIVHVPTCLGAVALTYSLPGNPRLHLSPDLIADIFLGNITRWSDSRLARLNPGRSLPALPIRVVHRGDSSGTTFIFSEYLAKTSAVWKERMGAGKRLRWTVGIAGEGNPGVAGLVRQAPGSIGYVELIYALGNDLTVAAVQNRSRAFVDPTPDTVALAANVPLPDDTNISLTDTAAPGGYPLSSFTWLALYREQAYDGRPRDRAEALARLLGFVVREGQAYARSLHYAPLPDDATREAEALVKSVSYLSNRISR
jgi:phosphate transport system substrate-binding protein